MSLELFLLIFRWIP